MCTIVKKTEIALTWTIAAFSFGLTAAARAQPACAPTPDELGCAGETCPIPEDACLPARVRYNHLTGQYRVLECACQASTSCHVEFNPIGPPAPPTCAGECPPGQVCEQRVTFVTENEDDYECVCVPICEVTPDGLGCENNGCLFNASCYPTRIRRELDGSFRVTECSCIDTFGPICHVDFGPTGEPVCANPIPCPSNPPQSCIMITSGHLDGTIDYRCDCFDMPPACGPLAGGQACEGVCVDLQEACVPSKIRTSPSGRFEAVECQCRMPDPCRPMVTQAGPPPPAVICNGLCLANEACEPINETVIDDGSVDTSCACVSLTPQACCFPDGNCADLSESQCQAQGGQPAGQGTSCDTISCPPPTECAPTPDELSCNPGTCPNLSEECVPQRIRFNAVTAQYRVLECACQNPFTCHVESSPAGPAGPPTCTGQCPPGQTCERVVTFVSENEDDYECRCMEQFQGCGTLVPGPQTCVAFEPDIGGWYLLQDPGGFNVGDRAWFRGRINPESQICSPYTLPGIEDNVVRVCRGGDFDSDGDVDQEDYDHFQGCLTGPNPAVPDPTCANADLDADDDVDLKDFGGFQMEYDP